MPSGKGELQDGDLVKNFRKLMGQMASCMKGFELMSKNLSDSFEMMKSLCNGDRASKVVLLEEEVSRLRSRVTCLENRILQLVVAKEPSVPSKQKPSYSSVVSSNLPAGFRSVVNSRRAVIPSRIIYQDNH